MTAIDRTAYPRFRATLTPSELHERFPSSTAELALCEAQTPAAAGKLAFLTLYKCMQVLNYLSDEEEIPPEVMEHLRWYLHLDANVLAEVAPRSRRRYAHVIRQAIGVKHAVQEARQVARAAMEQAAHVRDHPADLINAALETLLKQWYEFPAFSALDRLAGTVRAEVNERWRQQTSPASWLPNANGSDGCWRHRMASLTMPGSKRHPKAPPSRIWTDGSSGCAGSSRLGRWPPGFKMRRFSKSTIWLPKPALDVAELRDYTLPRRLALVVSLLYYSQIQTRDELVTMLIKRMAAIHHQAKEHLDVLLKQERATMERWMEGLAEITRSVAAGTGDPTVGQVARTVVAHVGGPTQFLSTYETLATYHGNNYLPFTLSCSAAVITTHR